MMEQLDEDVDERKFRDALYRAVKTKVLMRKPDSFLSTWSRPKGGQPLLYMRAKGTECRT